jgi:hypothetical protein
MPPETFDETKARIIKMAWDRNDIFPDDSGYYVYDPSAQGYFPAWALRVLADELDRANADWDKQINDYFAGVPDEPEPLDLPLEQLHGI